jgi:hypothetical protein
LHQKKSKTGGMAKKIVLDYDEEVEYSIIGISSQLKDYRLIFFLNQTLNTNFKRINSFFLPSKNVDFSMYQFEDTSNISSLFFLSNRSDGNYLFPEFALMDYLILVSGEVQEEYLQKINTDIRTIQYVQISKVLNTSKVKNYYDTIFEFENHLQSLKPIKKDVSKS